MSKRKYDCVVCDLSADEPIHPECHIAWCEGLIYELKEGISKGVRKIPWDIAEFITSTKVTPEEEAQHYSLRLIRELQNIILHDKDAIMPDEIIDHICTTDYRSIDDYTEEKHRKALSAQTAERSGGQH